jgi:RNA polymerase subunit RPABC4/transcription elongation factor Spt4
LGNDFTGKICPYCMTKIKEEDDLVVCSICEMPHHRECWIENGGCTTFGCMGVEAVHRTVSVPTSVIISSCDHKQEKNSDNSICQKCGFLLGTEHNFCPNCGVPKNAPVNRSVSKCPACGYALSEKHRFCPSCGIQIADLLLLDRIN